MPSHPASDLDALDLNAPEEMDVRFAVDDDVVRGEAAGNFPDEIDRGCADAIHVAAHFPFDEGRAAGHHRAAEIAFRGDVNLALGLDGPAKAGRDFIMAQVDVGTALRAKT